NDISDRKRREHEVANLNAALAERAGALQAANKELESFAYSVSHDLRAPLRHVFGFAELLQKHSALDLDEKGRGYVRTIQDSGRRMGNLIDDLLGFSRMARAETKKTVVNLEQLVHEAISELAGETGGRDIAWKIEKLPCCYGDRSLLKLVFQNLIGMPSNSRVHENTRRSRLAALPTNRTRPSSSSATTAWASTCATPTSFSACF